LFFVFQVRSINPSLSDVVIHVVAATNGKENANVVEKLLGLTRILESGYALDVISLASHGDSCFDGLHSHMSADLCGQRDLYDPGLPNLYTEHLVICDPLQL
jgi:hypothetical protein